MRQRHSIVTASGLAPGRGKMGFDQQANRFTYAVKGKLRNIAEQLRCVQRPAKYHTKDSRVAAKPASAELIIATSKKV